MTVHLAGQTALDPDGRIVGDSVVEQFEQALGNLLTALRAAGGGPEHLASLTIYIVDVADYRAHAREIGEVWRRLVGTDYPAMAGIGVARLWDDEALVEVRGSPLQHLATSGVPSTPARSPGGVSARAGRRGRRTQAQQLEELRGGDALPAGRQQLQRQAGSR